jgi:hypothetical protein
MMKRECVRSADVMAAITTGPREGWPDDELRLHVDACESCRDMATVVSALRAERDVLRRSTSVPSAGLVWWRAQLRQRQQATFRAAAPVTAIHAAALVAAGVLAVVLVSSAGSWTGMPALSGWVPAMPAWADASRSLTTEFPSLRYGLMLGATAWLILGPVALYLALRRD